MLNKLKHYTKEVIFFILAMTLFANLISLYKSQDLNAKPLTLQSVQLLNQKNYTIENNKPILVHIWATWCPTCKLEAGNIERISKHYQVLSIAVKSGSDKEISEYMKEHNLHFKVMNDTDGQLSSKFKIAAFPTTFIYDTNKNLLFSEVGYTSTFGLWLRMWWASLK